MKYKNCLIAGACIAAATLATSVPALAAAKKKDATPAASASASPAASTAQSPVAKTARGVPFHGTVSTVDASAKTFTIAGKTNSRVFKVTDQTTVTKNGATATITDIAANAKVSGSYLKQPDGSLECKTVKITGAADAAANSGSTKKSKKAAAAESTTASPAASASPSAPAKK
jgi:hypothetical protein